MPPLYLLEPDSPGAAWLPFTGVRPIAELRAGAWRLRERWEGILGAETKALIGAHVVGFLELDDAQPLPEGSTVLGDPSHIVLVSTELESGVTFDIRQGAIVVEFGAEI